MLRFGFRADAPPFSYCVRGDRCPDGGCAYQSAACGADGWIDGYSVRICQRVGDFLLGRAGSGAASQRFQSYAFVEVTAENRFAMLEAGEVDVLCGADTVTLKRLRDYRSSIYTFVSGASVMYPHDKVVDGPEDLSGLQVGVLGHTTTMNQVERIHASAAGGGGFTIRRMTSHMQAVELLKSRAARLAGTDASTAPADGIDVYFADREILLWLLRDLDLRRDYAVSPSYFSLEPYALFMRGDAADLQYEVNLALIGLYADHPQDLVGIFSQSFGRAEPSRLLRSMYDIRPLRDGGE